MRFAEELIGGARREGRKFVQYYYDDPTIEGRRGHRFPEARLRGELPGAQLGAEGRHRLRHLSPQHGNNLPAGGAERGREVHLPLHLGAGADQPGRRSGRAQLHLHGRSRRGQRHRHRHARPPPAEDRPNAIDYLRDLEVPIPATGNRIGTLRVDVSGSSDTQRGGPDHHPHGRARGRAGLAYPGIPENEGFHDEAVYLCGLRDTRGTAPTWPSRTWGRRARSP